MTDKAKELLAELEKIKAILEAIPEDQAAEIRLTRESIKSSAAHLNNNDNFIMIEDLLEVLVNEGKKALEIFNKQGNPLAVELLLPRRQEIYQTISDHPQCSFEFISRRFLSVNIKTLQYDLAQLIKKGRVRKLGVTKGSVYEVIR